VGYTNAGKSTLLNHLANADVYVADQLFATLDPTTRRVLLPNGNPVLFTDTVGFIQKLPTTLVAAFRATLEEISEANLLLHVLDITHPNVQSQAKAVTQTLTDIEAAHIPVLTVLNKIDRLDNAQAAKESLESHENAVAISALTGDGLDDMLLLVQQHLYDTYKPLNIFLPYKEGHLISLFHEQGQIKRLEHVDGGVKIEGKVPVRLMSQFALYDHSSDNQEIS
jgi:GTP-binding protein HflX